MFGILSFTTEVTLWLATAIALLLTIFFWHKFSARKFRTIFARVSVLVLIQALAFSAVGITINRAGDFYDTWGDLFGSKNNLASIALSPESVSAITAQDVSKATRTSGGSLIFKKVITGANSLVSDYVYVVTSPAISNKLLSTSTPSIGTDYQVTELFPGYPGVPETWIGVLQGVATLEKMEASGQVPPTIAIIPAINVVPGLDTECLNIPGTSEVETWLTTDMKTFATKFLGIDNRPWSTFGYSTGGWCAAELSVRHQDQYNLAVSLAGYFSPTFSAGVNKRERKVLTAEYDIANSLAGTKNNLRMLIIYSKRDKFSFASMNDFVAKAGALITIKLVEIPNGGHNIKVWKPFVGTGFQWIADQKVSTTPTP